MNLLHPVIRKMFIQSQHVFRLNRMPKMIDKFLPQAQLIEIQNLIQIILHPARSRRRILVDQKVTKLAQIHPRNIIAVISQTCKQIIVTLVLNRKVKLVISSAKRELL